MRIYQGLLMLLPVHFWIKAEIFFNVLAVKFSIKKKVLSFCKKRTVGDVCHVVRPTQLALLLGIGLKLRAKILRLESLPLVAIDNMRVELSLLKDRC